MDYVLPHAFLSWCQDTPVAEWINSSASGFAIVETVHVLGLAVLLAGIVSLDCRLLGLLNSRRPVSDFASAVNPIIWVAMVLLVVTGVARFLSQAVEYSHSPWFLAKVLLLAVGITTHLTLVRKATATAELTPIHYRKLAAYASLICWIGVAVADRNITNLP